MHSPCYLCRGISLGGQFSQTLNHQLSLLGCLMINSCAIYTWEWALVPNFAILVAAMLTLLGLPCDHFQSRIDHYVLGKGERSPITEYNHSTNTPSTILDNSAPLADYYRA